MAATSRKKTSALFEKDEDTLPFFSIHPKTKAGMILRIILCVFLLLVCILTLLQAKAGLLYIRYCDLYYLIYAVPAFIFLALIIVALFKRMKRVITKIAVPGIIVLFCMTIGLAIFSMMSTTCGYVLSPAAVMDTNYGKIMLMRSCADPDDAEEVVNEEGGTYLRYPARAEAYRYTGKAFAEEDCEVSGEIFVPIKATYEVKEEWVNDSTLRFYIASDDSGYGYGEILMKFGSAGEDNTEPGESALFRNRFTNGSGSHTGDLYREESSITVMTDSVFTLPEEAFKRVYTAFPLKMNWFIKVNVRSEGGIVLEPYGEINSFTVDYGSIENAIVISPGEDCVGASGSITIYPNETVELDQTKNDE